MYLESKSAGTRRSGNGRKSRRTGWCDRATWRTQRLREDGLQEANRGDEEECAHARERSVMDREGGAAVGSVASLAQAIDGEVLLSAESKPWTSCRVRNAIWEGQSRRLKANLQHP